MRPLSDDLKKKYPKGNRSSNHNSVPVDPETHISDGQPNSTHIETIKNQINVPIHPVTRPASLFEVTNPITIDNGTSINTSVSGVN